jgi:hypothetical protein
MFTEGRSNSLVRRHIEHAEGWDNILQARILVRYRGWRNFGIAVSFRFVPGIHYKTVWLLD